MSGGPVTNVGLQCEQTILSEPRGYSKVYVLFLFVQEYLDTQQRCVLRIVLWICVTNERPKRRPICTSFVFCIYVSVLQTFVLCIYLLILSRMIWIG